MSSQSLLEQVSEQFNSSIKIENSNATENLAIERTAVVQVPKDIKSIAVDEKDIRTIYKACEQASKGKIVKADLFLGIATLFAGAFISGILAGVTIALSWKCIVFIIVSPVISIGTGVAYYFSKKIESINIETLVYTIKNSLPDIEEGVEK